MNNDRGHGADCRCGAAGAFGNNGYSRDPDSQSVRRCDAGGYIDLVSAGLFVVMDAVDVAFTEAAVGAGISTVLLLCTLALVGYKESKPQHTPILPLFVVIVTGGVLVYGTAEIPPFGGPDNPAHQNVAAHYIHDSEGEIGHIPNVVTSVLASYRGYDTMGETAVIFTAMVGVLLLLSRGSLPKRVYHAGHWHEVKRGVTREDLIEEMEDEEAHDAPSWEEGEDG